MQAVLIIVFAFIGLWLASASDELLGIGTGILVGYLLGRIRELQRRMGVLEAERARETTRPAAAQESRRADRPVADAVSLYEPEPASAAPPPAAPEPAARPAPSGRFKAPEPDVPAPRAPSPADKLLEAAKRWMTTGNVPVKVGIIVSFFGVSFLLKYAVERQVLVVPLEVRYLLVAVAAVGMLAFGWRLRERMRVYALSLQGGGIGILYLTIFAAFRLHPLLPAPFAFALLVLLTLSTGVLAVLQGEKWLAVFATVGGFLAPILVSTGSGNHVALFSYYLLLNTAVLGIAWYRAWRILNLLGFVFTFGVGTIWGYEYYRPELLGSVEPFLVAFFLFYQAIAILFALRQPPHLRGLVDGTLIFGTPVIAFALQARLVEHTEYGLTISAVLVAVFYTMLCIWLHRSRRREMGLMIETYIALAVAFATIAIPLALDDRWTAVAWALEGAALVWIGVRQNGFLARLSGAALLGASGIAFLHDGWRSGEGIAVLNGNFLGGMLISVASFFASRRLSVDAKPLPFQGLGVIVLFVWGFGWWAGVGTAEIFDRLSGASELHALALFAGASALCLAWLARRLEWAIARQATLAFLPTAVVLGVAYVARFHHPIFGLGALSWIIAAAAHFFVLRTYADQPPRLAGTWHVLGALLIGAMLGWETLWRMDHAGFGLVWSASTAMLVPVAGALFIDIGRQYLVWPLQRFSNAYLIAAAVFLATQLVSVGIAGMIDSGNPAPLPYIPVLNPFDLLTLAGLATALFVALSSRSASTWLAGERLRIILIAWGVAAFSLSTLGVVRGVHNLGHIPWQQNALMASVAVQSALSIYWATLGLGGMVWGARSVRRWLWMAGTGLMALVVAKLFLIDLGNTGTLARIVSFLGVGAMLLAVGYFAPAPPKQVSETVPAANA